jgi:ubiquinone/menaquinone biosynthesis C-methylase UbiE
MPRWGRVVGLLVPVLLVSLLGYAAAWGLLIAAGDRLTLRQLALQPGLQVLDVGCGSGRMTLPMAERVGSTGRALGIDISARRLRRAERRIRAAGITNARFERACAGEGKLPAEQFDRALLLAVLGEMAHPEAALADIFRALKPGGTLSITEGFLDPHHQRPERIRHLAKAAGFDMESCAGTRWLFTLNLRKPPTVSNVQGAGVP